MLTCVQGMRRLVGSVFFSMLFLFGFFSTNVLAVDSQKAAQEKYRIHCQSRRYSLRNCPRIWCDLATACDGKRYRPTKTDQVGGKN